jgi:hypothetical protein
VAAEGWQRAPAPVDPASTRWAREPTATRDGVLSVVPTAPVLDEHPVPSTDASHPRLERVLAWVAPWWAARRQATRVARYQRAVWARIAAAQDDRQRARDLPSRAGSSWRGSQYWHR